jgi:hypothetical protein
MLANASGQKSAHPSETCYGRIHCPLRKQLLLCVTEAHVAFAAGCLSQAALALLTNHIVANGFRSRVNSTG